MVQALATDLRLHSCLALLNLIQENRLLLFLVLQNRTRIAT